MLCGFLMAHEANENQEDQSSGQEKYEPLRQGVGGCLFLNWFLLLLDLVVADAVLYPNTRLSSPIDFLILLWFALSISLLGPLIWLGLTNVIVNKIKKTRVEADYDSK